MFLDGKPWESELKSQFFERNAIFTQRMGSNGNGGGPPAWENYSIRFDVACSVVLSKRSAVRNTLRPQSLLVASVAIPKSDSYVDVDVDPRPFFLAIPKPISKNSVIVRSTELLGGARVEAEG